MYIGFCAVSLNNRRSRDITTNVVCCKKFHIQMMITNENIEGQQTFIDFVGRQANKTQEK